MAKLRLEGCDIGGGAIVGRGEGEKARAKVEERRRSEEEEAGEGEEGVNGVGVEMGIKGGG